MTRIAPFDGLPRSGLPGSSGWHRAGSPAPRALTALGLAATATAAATAAAAVTAAAWHSSRGLRGAIGVGPAGLHLHCTSARPPEAAESVSVLIPVRHRPDAAIAAVRAALGQQGVDHLDVVVLDDGCPQETRTALRQEFGDDPRVRILSAAPLPRGWSPLAHRSHQLAVAARGKVLIFAEPCAPLGPNAAASATALLRTEQLDLVILDTGRPAQRAQAQAPEEACSVEGGHGTRDGARGRTNETRLGVVGQVVSGSRSGSGGRSDVGAETEAGSVKELRRSRSKDRARTRTHGGARVHPGRFAVAIDAEAYWRIGGYRAAAGDSDPLALLRMVRRASGRVAIADGRRVIPPAQLLDPLPSPDVQAGAEWDGTHGSSSRTSLTGTARRVIAAMVGVRP